jgi:hypothetical protein
VKLFRTSGRSRLVTLHAWSSACVVADAVGATCGAPRVVEGFSFGGGLGDAFHDVIRSSRLVLPETELCLSWYQYVLVPSTHCHVLEQASRSG